MPADDAAASSSTGAAPVRMSMMSAKPKKLAPQPAAAGFASAAELREAAPKEESVEELVEGSIGKDNEPMVIAAIGNTFHLGGAQHLRPGAQRAAAGEAEALEAGEPSAEAAPAAAAADEEAAPAAAAAAPAAAALDADAEAAQALLAEVRKSGGAGIFGTGAVDEAEMYRLDVATRAEGADDEAYERMPIEQFGKAYLRGYNWKEGEAVGKNGEVIEPVEYVARPQLLGLGAQPKAADDGGKANKKYIKPGESREAKKDMVYIDEHGRQRHVKKVGEQLVEREKVGLVKDALVAVTAGAHKGLYGRILSVGGLEKAMRAQIKLTLNGEVVSVEVGQLQPVKDAKLEKARPGFTHEQAEREDRAEKRERDDGRERERDRDGDRDRRERERDRDGDERERKHHKHDKHDKHECAARLAASRAPRAAAGARCCGLGLARPCPARLPRGSKRDKHHKHSKRDRHERDDGHHRRAEAAESGGGRTWARENIRVRVVDKRLQGGKLYTKKGVVTDVAGADALSLRMDDGTMVEGVAASAVETALPKVGGAVLCVRGAHSNRRGRLLERHSEQARAVVQLNGDFQIVEATFDEVAEWVGVAGEDLEDDNM